MKIRCPQFVCSLLFCPKKAKRLLPKTAEPAPRLRARSPLLPCSGGAGAAPRPADLCHPSPACPAGTFGRSCSQACRCMNGGTCEPSTGACRCPPGVAGPRCEDGKSPGRGGGQRGSVCPSLHASAAPLLRFGERVPSHPCCRQMFLLGFSGALGGFPQSLVLVPLELLAESIVGSSQCLRDPDASLLHPCSVFLSPKALKSGGHNLKTQKQ